MRNIFIILTITFLLSVTCDGQELLCGTPSILDDSITIAQLRSIRHAQSVRPNTDTLYFRLQIHIIRNNTHETSLNISALERDLDPLNTYYMPAAIKFYVCNGYNYIDNDLYYEFHYTDESYLITTYNDPYAINIFFADKVYNSSGSSVAGYSYYPSSNRNFIAINNQYVGQMTLMHEVGHFFNLRHTHDHAFGYELVNGTNCETAGDLCCDTPADPQLSYSNVNADCIYIGTDTDANGDLYNPNPHNIMSYARKVCRNLFSNNQYERIRDAAFLPNRQALCSHRLVLENGALTNDTTISNDYVIVQNYSMNADSIRVSACKEIILDHSVVLEKGVTLQPKD